VRWRGVSYDVGRVLGGNWRPVFDPVVVRRELEIIKEDLHCNAVRICARDIGRLTEAAGIALDTGLDVWLSPELWNKSPEATYRYVVEAASSAEALRRQWPGKVVLCVGSELTLFMRGIMPGRSLLRRIRTFRKRADHQRFAEPLNDFLRRVIQGVREVFVGPITYASLVWEQVDWTMFDIVGVDHYRDSRIKDRYVDLLRPHFDTGKPVVVTEFGMRSYVGADTSGTLGFGVVNIPSMVLHKLPLVGRFVRVRLKGHQVRDEALQAREIADTLAILDSAGVVGAFVCTFVDYLAPTSADPRYDLDMSALSIVKLIEGRQGTTYPDMEWEPKAAFGAIAGFYGADQ
jgi:hypothetical protein